MRLMMLFTSFLPKTCFMRRNTVSAYLTNGWMEHTENTATDRASCRLVCDAKAACVVDVTAQNQTQLTASSDIPGEKVIWTLLELRRAPCSREERIRRSTSALSNSSVGGGARGFSHSKCITSGRTGTSICASGSCKA